MKGVLFNQINVYVSGISPSELTIGVFPDPLERPLGHCSGMDLLIQTQTSSTSFPATETQETLQMPAMRED